MKANSIFRPAISLANCLLGCLFMLFSIQGFGQTYCTPTGVSCNTAPNNQPFYITDLWVGLDPSPSLTAAIRLPSNSCPATGYKDETNSIDVMPWSPGKQLVIFADVLTNTPTNTSAGLWIDYNKDGTFNNTNEFVGTYALGSGSPSSSNPTVFVNLPASGYSFGRVRARFRILRDANISSTNACGSLSNPSDCRDFLINISPNCFQPATPRHCIFNNGCTYKSNYFTSVSFSSSLGTTTQNSTFGQIGYSDYNTLNPRVPFGGTVTISGNIFRENPDGEAYNWLTIWADWNNDNIYDANAGELVGFNNLPNNSNGNIPFSYAVTVPATVTTPKVNIRLMTNYAGIVNGCTFAGSLPFIGETEDYSLLVAPAGVITPVTETLCSPANPASFGFSTLPTGSVYYYWYYQDGSAVAQPTGTAQPTAPWIPITNNNPITGLPTMTTYDPPAGLTTNRYYACFVKSRIIGNPAPGWALGMKRVRIKSCSRLAVSSDLNEEENGTFVESENLSQNFPNPFTTETTIPCFVPEETKTASLEIFGLDGRKVQQIHLSGTGKQDVLIQSKMLPSSGMYLYTLVIDGQKQPMMRMVMAK
jgi:hypothetical protein